MNRSIFPAAILSVLCVGCFTLDGHQNFINIYSRQVGRSADAFYRDQLVSTKTLSNGNIEEKHGAGLWRGDQQCFVFFEIDPNSRKILSWRYEGSDDICRVPL